METTDIEEKHTWFQWKHIKEIKNQDDTHKLFPWSVLFSQSSPCLNRAIERSFTQEKLIKKRKESIDKEKQEIQKKKNLSKLIKEIKKEN